MNKTTELYKKFKNIYYFINFLTEFKSKIIKKFIIKKKIIEN